MDLSRVEKELEVILGYHIDLEYPDSRLERILRSIIDGTSYTEPLLSRIEEDFIAYKDGEESKNELSRIERILKAITSNSEYDGDVLSRVEELLIGLIVPQDYYLLDDDGYYLTDADGLILLVRH